MTGYQSKRAAAQDKEIVTDIDGHVVRDARKPKKAQPAQKPDTYRSVPHGHCTHPICKEVFSAYIEVNKRLAHYEPEGKSPMILNAAPPQRPWVLQREWVDLTNEEIDKWAHELHGVIYAVMADLKEKNNG